MPHKGAFVLIWLTACAFAATANAASSVPLSELYPGDAGIASDPSVILAEDFEGERFDAWDNRGAQDGALELERDPSNVHGGKQSVRMTATLGKDNGSYLFKRFDGHDDVYARFYVKFAEDCDYVHHFVHLVAENNANKWPSGGAGLLPAGDAKFSTGLEPTGKWGRYPPPGAWNFYSYWWQMKGAPDGKYWGNSFEPKTPVVPERGRWYCVEMRLTANTPPNADGEQAFWIDGVPVGRFGGINWRNTDALKVNAFWLLFYVTGQSTKNPINRVYFDDIVVATRYVGPKTDRR